MAQAASSYTTADEIGDLYDSIIRLKNLAFTLGWIITHQEPGLELIARLLLLEISILEKAHCAASNLRHGQ